MARITHWMRPEGTERGARVGKKRKRKKEKYGFAENEKVLAERERNEYWRQKGKERQKWTEVIYCRN